MSPRESVCACICMRVSESVFAVVRMSECMGVGEVRSHPTFHLLSPNK